MNKLESGSALRIRLIVGIGIMLIIAAIHAFRIGTYLHGEWYSLYYSYASDILLPFGVYYLLSINEFQFKFLQKWWVKVIIIFCAMTFSEIMQYFGIYFFGVTFDPLDILMYSIGALLAAYFDTQVFDKFIPSWNYNK